MEKGLEFKLKKYISRYHLAVGLRGFAAFLSLALVLWLALAGAEHFGRFSSEYRTWLFFGFIALAGGHFIWVVSRPLLMALGFLGQKTEQEAARDLGAYFTNIDDKLTNYLQLKSAQLAGEPHSLLLAAVQQKAQAFDGIEFTQAVPWRQVQRAFWQASIPVAIFFTLHALAPKAFVESGARLLAYQQEFVPPAPFKFVVLNERLTAFEGEPVLLRVTTEGSVSPAQVWMQLGDHQVRMSATNDAFEYLIEKAQSDFEFSLRVGEIASDVFNFRVLSTPKVIDNAATLNYPPHTALGSEVLKHRSSLTVPEGTSIEWLFRAANGTSLAAINPQLGPIDQPDQLTIVHRALQNDTFLVVATSTDSVTDTHTVSITVVPDNYPSVEADIEGLEGRPTVRFNGRAEDDYGLSALFLIVKADEKEVLRHRLNSDKNIPEFAFDFELNLDSLGLAPGSEVICYMEAVDNDGVNGPKASRSAAWKQKTASLDELQNARQESSEELKNALEKELEGLKELENEMSQLQKELAQKPKSDWEDKEQLREILMKQQQTVKAIMEKTEKQQQAMARQQNSETFSPELMEKQRQLEELMQRVLSDEMREKMAELNKLMDELNKNQLMEKLNEQKAENEELEEQLDRSLELFKQLEYELKMEETIKAASKLKEDLKQQSEENASEKPTEESSENHQQAAEDLKQFEEKLEELNALNEELTEPSDLPDMSQEMNDAKENMEKAGEELEKQNGKSASEKQSKAADAMQKMEEKLSQSQEQNSQQANQENLEDLRQLLENIVDLSHSQEALQQQLRSIETTNPQFVAHTKAQKDLLDDLSQVEDSLNALAKRVVELGPPIYKELGAAKKQMSSSLEYLRHQPPNEEKQYKEKSQVTQQLAMTSLNNLAVLIDEVTEQLQQQANSKMKGSGQCSKPGSGQGAKPGMANAKQMQQMLNQRLEQLRKDLANGSKDGTKPGQKPGSGNQGMSREMARLAGEQAAIREQLRELSNALNNDGTGEKAGNKQLRELQEMMEKTEEDLLYQRITQETLRRQQDIMSRLLESEKAERERDEKPEREAEQSIGQFANPIKHIDINSVKAAGEKEIIQTPAPNLKPYYKRQVMRYFGQTQAIANEQQ